jgi:hypothetical protein
VVSNEPDGWISEIDSALSKWSQGDCTIGDDCWFVTCFDPQRPVTLEAKNFVIAEANVEKAVVAAWERILGCQSDADTRSLAEALARKRSRFAFPDDFNRFTHKLQKRMQDKHEKNTDEGEALRALREISVSATPAWDADTVELIFWFIRVDTDDRFQDKEWHEWLNSWLQFLPASGRFSSVDGSVVTLDDMTDQEYVHSDRLDLDRLSSC